MIKPIVFVLLFAVIYPVSGQQKMSLSEAVEIGLKNNYDIRIEQKNIEIASGNNNWGEAGRFPSLNLNIGQNNSITDNVKTATPFQTQGKTLANNLSPTISLNWELFNGFKVSITKARLNSLQEETQGNASIVIANTIQSIILGYYVAVLEQQRLSLFEKNLMLSRDKYDYLRIKKDLGSAVTTELLLEENNYLTDSVTYINQKLQYRNSVRALNILLAIDEIDTMPEFTDSLTVENVAYRYDDLLAKVISDNVDLRKQYLSQAVLAYDTRLRKADRHPKFSVNSGYTYSGTRIDLSEASFPGREGGAPTPGPQDPLSTTTTTLFANFTLSFNLFNGGKIKRAIRNAIIMEDIGNIRIEKLKSSLENDLVNAFDQYNTRRTIFDLNVRKEQAAETNLEISQEKFKNGTINSFDYRTVQNNYLSAAFDRLNSIYNLIDANVTLMRLTGGLLGEYQTSDQN